MIKASLIGRTVLGAFRWYLLLAAVTPLIFAPPERPITISARSTSPSPGLGQHRRAHRQALPT